MPNGAERSQALFERLCRTMPGANTRTATFYAPFPLAIERGEGPWIWDVDGNRLIDLVNNYTSLVHGHAAPPIVEAITAAARGGTVFPAPVLGQLELSERICARLDSIDQVRFTNSGTEATMHAVRCARAATGRPLLVKARHGYHGSWDGAPPVEDDVRGVPDPVRDTVVWVDFNEVASLEATMAAHGDQVAAILLEPMLGGGVVPGERPFFVAARELADRHGALLILDEVVTLRLHLRGYQDALGVRPDLTTLGKVIGGGLPIGGFAAPEALMSHYDPRVRDGITHHGTFNGNTLAMAAGVASLDLLDEAAIARINGLGARLAAGLRAAVERHGLEDAHVTEDGSLVQLHFDVAAPPRTGAELNPGSERLGLFHLAALANGVYVAPRGELNVTTAMDEGLVDESVAALEAALGLLR